MKDEKKRIVQRKLIRYHNQQGLKILFLALNAYFVKVLRVKINGDAIKKKLLLTFNSDNEVFEADYFEIAVKFLEPYLIKRKAKLNEKKLKKESRFSQSSFFLLTSSQKSVVESQYKILKYPLSRYDIVDFILYN